MTSVDRTRSATFTRWSAFRSRVASRATIVVVGAAAALAVAAACSEGPATRVTAAGRNAEMAAHATAQGELTTEQLAAIAQVRAATAQFHDTLASRNAGYTLQFPAGCIASPEGAQGIHFMNPALVDTVVDLLHPELVMYEPQADGSKELVGVDYVVPVDQWTHPYPPSLLGVPFMRIDALGVWALHIWGWRPNPSGMFSMWNPKVSCTLGQ